METSTDGVPGTAAGTRWLMPKPIGKVPQFEGFPSLPTWMTSLLWRRGIQTSEQAQGFLKPSFEDLHDPFLLRGMNLAVERVLLAVQRREQVLIYGDYDVDGTLATVLLKTAIDRITPKGVSSLVRYHIPHRIREGYGVQTAVLGEAATSGIGLVISVDTGIRAFAAAEEARKLGLDLIVTDHHLPEDCGVPEAIAVINPNQAGCPYPFQELCGAAVAYKLGQALLCTVAGKADPKGLCPVEEQSLRRRLLPSLLKLVAIATVADSVPLVGENRTIVSLGLSELRAVNQPGLRSLLRLAKVGEDGFAPSSTEIAFRVGPRINAAGRMDVAGDVVRLFLTRDEEEGRVLAEKLHRLNDERRAVEQEVLEKIDAQLRERLASTVLDEAGCLVLDGEGWHRGVVGILASRVVERTGKPALVVTHEDGVAHGSGRSVDGFHLLDAITAAHLNFRGNQGAEEQPSGLFHRFGGHAHAVGFSLPSENVAPLREALAQYARGRLTQELTTRTLVVDADLPLREIDGETMRWIRLLEPFGNGNTDPVFYASGVRVAEIRVLKDRHLKMKLEQDGARAVSCLCWSRSVEWPECIRRMGIEVGARIDIAFRLKENRHPTFGGPELELCDLRASW